LSNVCKSCNQTISWDAETRKKLGIRGQLNPDGSIHRCMGLHKANEVLEATTSAMPTPTTTTSEVDISTGTSSTPTPAAKVYPYEVKLEQCSPGIRITVHARDEDPNVVVEQAIAIYKLTKIRLEEVGEKIAPVEAKK
jgi:hypothetical protein